MRVNQYSSRRNMRPGFPTAEEIKRTTEAWKGDGLAQHEAAKMVVNEAKTEKPRHF